MNPADRLRQWEIEAERRLAAGDPDTEHLHRFIEDSQALRMILEAGGDLIDEQRPDWWPTGLAWPPDGDDDDTEASKIYDSQDQDRASRGVSLPPDFFGATPPWCFRGAGRTLWETFEARHGEGGSRPLLVEACSTADLIADMSRRIRVDGLMLGWGSDGQERAHPLLSHLAAARTLHARQLKVLNSPPPDLEEGGMATAGAHRMSAVIRLRLAACRLGLHSWQLAITAPGNAVYRGCRWCTAATIIPARRMGPEPNMETTLAAVDQVVDGRPVNVGQVDTGLLLAVAAVLAENYDPSMLRRMRDRAAAQHLFNGSGWPVASLAVPDE